MQDPKLFDTADDAIADYVAAASTVLGLDSAREWRAGIAANFKLLAAAAAAIENVTPADDLESALVFTA